VAGSRSGDADVEEGSGEGGEEAEDQPATAVARAGEGGPAGEAEEQVFNLVGRTAVICAN
jgi:hypothetical protein